MGWLRRNWKSIVTAVVATVVFVAVAAAVPLLIAGAPVIAALAVAGVASGVAGYVTGQLLNRQPITARGVIVSGAIGGIVTVATAGVLTVAAPVVSRVVGPMLPRVIPRVWNATPLAVRTSTVNTTVGATLGGGTKVAANAVTGRPLDEGVWDATTVGALNGLLMSPTQRLTQAAVARGLRPTRTQLMERGLRRYEESVENSPPELRAGAQENLNHVRRLLAAVDENEAAIRSMGLDPERVKLQLLYSDTFKDPASVAREAQRLFPALYADPRTQGLAKLKALLLHEEPALALFQEEAAAVGLPRNETRRVADGIRGHNGPASEGSFWGNMWKAHIETEAPRPGSNMLGRPYPNPSREAALPTFLDRFDSRLTWDPAAGRYSGGPVKFLNEGVARGESLRKAWDSATQVAYDGTARQLADLRRLHPDLFRQPFVAKASGELELTIAVRDRVRFVDDAGTIAEVLTPRGPVRVTDPAGLWGALAEGHAPAAVSNPSATNGFANAIAR